jgi:hypothetical protein
LGEKNDKVAAAYCPVMFSERSLFEDAHLLQGQGFVHLLSLKGMESCPVDRRIKSVSTPIASPAPLRLESCPR